MTVTTDPSVRELAMQLEALKELLIAKYDALVQIMNERDELYTERAGSSKAAVDAALVSSKEATKASFEASEKAIVKAEEAQKSYNASHNDLARKMDEQGKATMPRTETESRFHALEEKLNELRNQLTSSNALILGGKGVKDESRSNLALAISVFGLIAMIVFSFFRR